MTQNNITILNALQERNIPNYVKQDILPILQQYINRIQFVKNFIGLRDVMYFEEEGLYIYEHPLHLSLNCPTQTEDMNDVASLFAVQYENAIVDIGQIIESLKDFFENTDRILYVEVGFEENILNNEDMWDVYNSMEDNRDKEPFELMLDFYKYPSWYDVKDGREIARMDYSLYLIKRLENRFLQKEIDEMKNQIDQLLLEENFSEAQSAKNKMKHLERQVINN